ncbi:hypothetical protein C8Q73DRAFT_126240 [Cubamyces lactineus]|nr:hypothetical protein C8Q73DRAFT_126240 [Cubamyces lactineus]
MPKTCALCRQRGECCDGLQPVCTQCAGFADPAVGCDYSSRAAGSTKAKASNLLQKGAACLPCRRKKKKCDAKRPHCTTCKTANRQGHCIYEEDAQRNLIHSLIVRTRELEGKLMSSDRDPSPPTQYPTPLPLIECTRHQYLAAVPVWSPPVIEPLVPRLDSLCSQDSLERLREYRLTFIRFCPNVGIKLSPQVLHAIITGDPFDPDLPHILLHAARLVGHLVWQDNRRTTCISTVEAYELETTLTLLNHGDIPPLLTLQIHNCLIIYYFVRGLLTQGMAHVRMAAELVHSHGLRFCPPTIDLWDPLQEPRAEDEELVCALSHLLYICISATMVLGWPSDLGPEYEEEFRTVTLLYPTLARSFLSILRARNILLLQRTRQLSDQLHMLPSSPWDAIPGHPQQPDEAAWLAEYWSLLEEVQLNLAAINPALLRSSMQPEERELTHALKICIIVALTAEAALHHLAPRSHAESRQQCMSSVLKLTGIGKTLTAADYHGLDYMLGVCWMMAANVMFEESEDPVDELCAMNWATARSVLFACVPVLVGALPHMAGALQGILERANFTMASV